MVTYLLRASCLKKCAILPIVALHPIDSAMGGVSNFESNPYTFVWKQTRLASDLHKTAAVWVQTDQTVTSFQAHTRPTAAGMSCNATHDSREELPVGYLILAF